MFLYLYHHEKNKTMQKALYFMPDISGFTNFVNNTELAHGIHIISELLELLIDNTIIDLELVEIEGDALFMFTTNTPNYKQLINQVELMLEKFHMHTKSYEKKRICSCGSCRTTTNLELKFIVHYGELNFIKVKSFVKPYGREVIKIHRLLKNEVPVNEYILITNETHELYKEEIDNSWEASKENYDLGNINYFYKNLEKIKNNINPEDSKVDFEDNKSLPSIRIEKIINADIQNVYVYISELKYRHLWDKEVKRIDFDTNKVNRVGTKHNCVLKIGNLNFETISNNKSNDLIYGENTKDMMFTKDFSYLIKLNKLDKNKTNIEVSLFLEFTTIGAFMKSNILKMLTKMWKKKLNQLELVLSEVN